MHKMLQIQRLLLRSRRLPYLVVGLALAVLAAAVILTALQVRRNIRGQIAGRDGEVLYAVALMSYEEEVRQGDEGSVGDPASQLSVLLKTSQLKGVMGARLFDAAGGFVHAFPAEVIESQLAAPELSLLKQLKPVSHFHPTVRLSALFLSEAASDTAVPLLEVNVPLHLRSAGQLAGVAQFLIEGQSIQAEFAQLDRHLLLQGFGIFVAGGVLLAAVILWAFRRLRRVHELLAARTDDLLKANQELALAAKASALGAVTAHLIHGLKNPLAGLQSFVSSQGTPPSGDQSDWQQAVVSTRRMQSMINEVIGLLREDETDLRYDVSVQELGEIVAARVMPQARERQVEFKMHLPATVVLPNRSASLLGLILVNLVQNAIEATPAGRTVVLSGAHSGEELLIEVRDQGKGFESSSPPFTPCRSTKEGGTGIGLALCKQLANHLGANLRLQSSTSEGCVFCLSIPAARAVKHSENRQGSAQREPLS